MTAPTTRLVPYAEALDRYLPVLGLETHVELSTASKMFCGCATEFGAEPNTHICPTCAGLPGALPVTNRAAIEHTIRIGLALGCRIASWCRFARKNYFYPDMPKNFQISQYDEPLCIDGAVDIVVDGTTFTIGIERVHLEEDTGKTLHVGGATGRIHGAVHSLVDFNRAGIPLVEIVTKPIEGTGHQAAEVARAYVTEVRDLVRSLGASDARMEQGSLRCDVNVSLMRPDAGAYGTRTETKNLNSFRSVERAVIHEVERQAARLDAGERIVQETRHFDEAGGTTSAGRSKEEAQDYRYFPEPDLVPIAPAPGWVDELRAAMPELPAVRRRRIAAEFGFSDLDMSQLANAGVLDNVEAAVAAGAAPAAVRGWWMGYLMGRAAELGVEPALLQLSARQLARVIGLEADGALTNKLARQVIDAVISGEGDPDEVIAAHGWAVADDSALADAVDSAIAAQPDVVERIRGGNVKAVGPLVGAVMQATGGQADAGRARQLILDRLGVIGT